LKLVVFVEFLCSLPVYYSEFPTGLQSVFSGSVNIPIIAGFLSIQVQFQINVTALNERTHGIQ